jgi:hypothetical protein
LRDAPNDPAANLAAGRWLCGYRGDWESGLAHLSRGSEALLAQAAGRENAGAMRSRDLFDCAELWWVVSEKSPFPRMEARRRAALWYSQATARSDLSPPLRATALKRLEEIAEADPRRSIDLLGIVDPHRDVFHGTFKWVGSDLQAVRGANDDIEFPVLPGEEYDYRIEFIRITGDDAVLQSMPCGSAYVNWVLGGWHNEFAGFEKIGEGFANANPSTVRHKPMLANGRRYVSLVQVRSDSLRAYLDGKLIAERKTDYHDITPHHLPRHDAFPTLTVWNSEAIITDARIIGISGEPKTVVPH